MTSKKNSSNNRRMHVLMMVFAAVSAGVKVWADPVPLTVAQGASLSISSSQENSAVNVHGALSVSGGTAAAPVVLTVTEAMNVGCDTADSATVTIGDFGKISMHPKTLTIGGPGGSGLVTVGGRRSTSTGVEVTDQSASNTRFFEDTAYHLRCGNIVVPAGTTAASGVLDIIRLDPNGVLSRANTYCKIQNLSSQCDVRILFNGGFLYDSNGFGATKEFASTNGKALILESLNENPIVLCYRWGNSSTVPTDGSVKTAGAGDVVVRSATGASNHFGWNLSATSFNWGHTGHFRLSDYMCVTCTQTNALPCLAAGGDIVLDGDSQYNWLDLNGKSQAVNGLITAAHSIVSNSASTTATLVFGSKRPNGTLCAPNITANINIEKVGAGTLTVTNTPSFDALTVKEGTVRFVSPVATVSLASVTVQAGATLVLDGVTVCAGLTDVDPDATVTVLNGGKLVFVSDVAADADGFVDNGSCLNAIEKTGDGTCTFAAASATDLTDIHVCGGTLAFARRGTTNEFWRVTIKETVASGNNLNLGPFRLYGEDGVFCDGGIANGTGASYARVENTTAPEDLQVKEVMFSSTNYKPSSEYEGGKHGSDNQTDPERAMFNNSTVFSCRFEFAPILGDDTTWRVATYRIPAQSGKFVVGYNVKSQWDGWNTRFPGAWKVESSPSGADGTWETMDEQTGQTATNGQRWYRGNPDYSNGYPMVATHRPSVGFAPNACVQVDANATLDCSRVTGRQEIANLVVDLSVGGGTLKNVRLASGGTLNLVNLPAGTKLSGYAVPLTFEDVSDTMNASSWSVQVAGVDRGAKLSWQNGGLYVSGPGFMILIR